MSDEVKKIQTARGEANAVIPLTPQSYSVRVNYQQSQGIVRGNGADWFGPLNPMAPVAPEEVAGRRFDYVTGYNLQTTPRGFELVGFPTMRALADSFDVLRLVIETRKDQISRLNWNFHVGKKDVKGKPKDATPGQKKKIEELTTFFRRPDGKQRWRPWLRSLLEDKFVVDAATLYCERNRGGKLTALRQLDGATIKVVLDDWGNTPEPWTENGALIIPPAYQQVLKGLPAVDYSTRDVLYRPHNRRVNKAYGYSEVEQIIITVNIAMRRQMFQLSYYTEGNVPEALIGTPDAWTPEQIMTFQTNFDAMLQGNLATRRRMKFVPGGVAKTFIPTKEPDLVNPMDEWLARVVCFAFSVSPQQFVKMMNRATAGTSADQAKEEGSEPLKEYVSDLVNDVAEAEFGVEPGDVEFGFAEETEVDQEKQQKIVSGYVADGLKTMNEGREMVGDEPSDDPAADVLMVKTATGYVPIGANTLEGKQAAIDAGLAPDPTMLTAPPGNTQDDPEPGSKNGGKQPPAPGKTKQNGPARPDPEKAPAAKVLPIAAYDHRHAILTAGFAKASRRSRRAVSAIPFDRPKSVRAERRVAKLLKGAFEEIAKDAAKRIRKLSKARTPKERADDVADNVNLNALDYIVADVGDEIGAASTDYASQALASIGVETTSDLVNQVNDRAVAVARDYAAALVGKRYDRKGNLVEAKRPEYRIDDSTRDMIRAAIADGLEENLSTDEIADQIADIGGFSQERAELIAHTEVRDANSAAAVDTYRIARDEAGVDVKKEWLLGANPCEICQENADAGPIDIDDVFPSGDSEPSAHPNCECAVAPVVVEPASSDDEE